LRKLKILAVTLAMTLAFATPAFASVLGETEVEVGGVELGTEFLAETEVEVGNFTLVIGSSD
jgi:hypothetical protein